MVVAMVWFGAIEREVEVAFTVLQGRLRRPFHPSDSEDENKEDLPSNALFSVVPVGEKSLISLTTPGFDGPSPNPFPQMLLFQLLVAVKPLPIVLWDGRARSPFIVEEDATLVPRFDRTLLCTAGVLAAIAEAIPIRIRIHTVCIRVQYLQRAPGGGADFGN